MQVEDVAQEIWARAVPAVQKGFAEMGPGSFLAFLGKIADRTMIDLARVMSADKRGGVDAPRIFSSDMDGSARVRPGHSVLETPTSGARVGELMALAQRELTDREFKAWDLVEVQGYSAEEAGLAMRCSGSAVRGILLRSRAKLVAHLG
ncbi:MAG: sigma-70 family RNA polymerase sigma factor [Planctomycetes bacterium]|nr:sigma-70 family RNA polymerase sigma factor [Planctomycetota bacterium]